MPDKPHACTYYCQEGLHAYLGLSPIEDDAADVQRSATIWLDYLGWPNAVARVALATEADPWQVLTETMLEVGHQDGYVAERAIVLEDIDLSSYRVWVIWIRET
jgi:hypothetical protein